MARRRNTASFPLKLVAVNTASTTQNKAVKTDPVTAPGNIVITGNTNPGNTVQPGKTAGGLWLCLYFPGLALEAAVARQHADNYHEVMQWQQVVVFKEAGKVQLVVQVSRVAADNGVVPGMSLAAACALCPGLIAYAREEKQEQRILERFARLAGEFSSTVFMLGADAVMLEIGDSLLLHGGIENLMNRVRAACDKQRYYCFRLTASPTVLSAYWLAVQGNETVIRDRTRLRSSLGSLPVTLPGFDAGTVRQLQRMGVRVLRDLWRLPGDGLEKRFGAALTDTLARALGVVPDIRETMSFPEIYTDETDLPQETGRYPLMLAVLRQLLVRFEHYLRQKDAGTDRIAVLFYHHDLPASEIRAGMRQSCRSAERMLELLREHLERTGLPAPVIAIGVRVENLRTFEAVSDSLFPDIGPETTGGVLSSRAGETRWQTLYEDMQVRFGRMPVSRLILRDDWRPECAWYYRSPESGKEKSCSHLRRPVWLLAVPKLLRWHQGGLHYQSALTLHSGPERIETGWWDGADVQRDYYIAVNREGAVLWVYRDLAGNRQWYLHGLFA